MAARQRVPAQLLLLSHARQRSPGTTTHTAPRRPLTSGTHHHLHHLHRHRRHQRPALAPAAARRPWRRRMASATPPPPPKGSGMASTTVRNHYRSLKGRYPDHVLLYQVGSFFEIMGEDAAQVSQSLPLRMSGSGMVGFPADRLSNWIPLFHQAGFTVAIADQVLDKTSATGIRKERQLQRIITPGTLPPELNLEAAVTPLLAVAPSSDGERYGLCWADVGTGAVQTLSCSAATLGDELGRIGPAEVIVPSRATGTTGRCLNISSVSESWDDAVALHEHAWEPSTRLNQYYVTAVPPAWFTVAAPTAKAYTGEQWRHLRDRFDPLEIRALRSVIEYLRETYVSVMPSLQAPTVYTRSQFLTMDSSTREALELTRRQRSNAFRGSLLDVLGRTRTAFGARELRTRLESPLLDIAEIDHRLDLIACFAANEQSVRETDTFLSGCADLVKLVQQLSSNVRMQEAFDCIVGMAQTLDAALKFRRGLEAAAQIPLEGEDGSLDVLLEHTAPAVLSPDLQDVVAFATRLGKAYDLSGMAQGLAPELDDKAQEIVTVEAEIRQLHRDLQSDLEAKHDDFRESCSPKKFVLAQDVREGWVLESSARFASLMRAEEDYFQCSKRGTSVVRFTTKGLLLLQERLNSLCSERDVLKFQLVQRVRETLLGLRPEIRLVAARLADLDAASTLAKLASKHALVRPEVVEDPAVFDVEQGRHLVVDIMQRDHAFVANDCHLSEDRMWLITGANMGGKSTFLRQNALIVILAQMGSFVPARSARVGLVDRIFTRVGASDNLAQHQSTFMLEMEETARILNDATQSSFVILDEIGRGTGPIEGLSLAWAITTYLARTQCRTLSATHYLHLGALCSRVDHVASHQLVSAQQGPGDVVMSHRVVPGIADQSFGIEIAELAGAPAEVVRNARRARQLLQGYAAGYEAAIAERGLPLDPD